MMCEVQCRVTNVVGKMATSCNFGHHGYATCLPIYSYICTLMFSTSGHFHSQTLLYYLYTMNNDEWLHVATWHKASGTSAVPFLNGPGDEAIVLQAHKYDETWFWLKHVLMYSHADYCWFHTITYS